MTKKTENLLITNHIAKAKDLELLSCIGVYKMWHVMKPEKIYIGSTSNKKRKSEWLNGFYTRWNSHLSELRRGVNESVGEFQLFVNKHGVDGVRFSILEICKNRSHCRQRENVYLKTTEHLWNNYRDVNWSAYPVDLFDMKGNFKGSFPTMADAAQGMGIDRASINNAILGNRPSAGGYLWTKKGEKPVIPIKRCITQLTLEGYVIAEWQSVESIRRAFKLTSTTAIRNAISGKQKKAYGFKWVEAHPKEVEHGNIY